MTRDEAIALMQIQLGFRTDQSANLVTCLQAAQQQLELQPTKPWFLVSTDYTLTTVAETEAVALPTDFLQEIDEQVLRYIPDEDDDADDDTSNEVDLVKDSYDVLRANFRDNVFGEPEAYALVGEYFRIFPTPDDEYTLKFIYYKKDTVLSSNVENGWLKWAPYLLMGKAGQLLSAGGLRDTGATQVFMGWEQQGAIALHAQNVAREMGNRDLQVGGPHV